MIFSNSEFISFSDAEHVFGSGDVQLINIAHPLFDACIAVQGAQLLSFKPKAQADWLWLDRQQSFLAGQEIVGGIPLCLPWFGRVKSPIHGFLRFSDWQLVSVDESDEQVALGFRFDHQGNDLAEGFIAEHCITLGSNINLQLDIHNMAKAQDVSFAWHSYFACQHSSEVLGLEGFNYYDNLRHWQKSKQQSPLLVDKPLDRVFCQLPEQPLSLDKLVLNANNAPSCIVWQPNQRDISYVCVERGAAFDDTITLAANEHFSSVLTIEKKG